MTKDPKRDPRLLATHRGAALKAIGKQGKSEEIQLCR